jgi:GGDEF domain-containing protein
MVERRVDFATRKRVAEMSPDEMRHALLVSEKTGLPNKRAFDEAKASPFVAMSDIDGLKTMNDQFGYSAGDMLIRAFAEVLLRVGLDAYHDKGDEFLCKGTSFQELNTKLSQARDLMKRQKFVAESMSGRVAKFEGAEFCFGIGTNLVEAERSLKHQKELRGHHSERLDGRGRGPAISSS